MSAGKFAAIVGTVAHDPKSSATYRALLGEHEELVHLTIDIQDCHEPEEAA